MFSLPLRTVLYNWQGKLSLISHHLFSNFKAVSTVSSSRSTLLTSISRKCLLVFGSRSKTITKHLDMCLFLKVGYYSLHHHLVFEQYHLYSCPSLWPHGHPSEVTPKKSLSDECPFTAAPLMRNGFSSRTDPAGRTHGNWAIKTQTALVYLTCNVSPKYYLFSASQSQGATVLSERSKPHRTDTLIIFNFYIPLENHFLSGSRGRREQTHHI